jgi:hypothetical protein
LGERRDPPHIGHGCSRSHQRTPPLRPIRPKVGCEATLTALMLAAGVPLQAFLD